MSMFLFDEQSGYVSLCEHPRDAGFPITSSQLIELIEQSSYADCELVDANIGKLLHLAVNIKINHWLLQKPLMHILKSPLMKKI